MPSNERKRQLRAEALQYAGQLVYEVVGTYSAFDELPDDERAFIDAYIKETGARMMDRASRMRRSRR